MRILGDTASTTAAMTTATAKTVTIERSRPPLLTASPPVGSALAATTKNTKNTTWTTPLAAEVNPMAAAATAVGATLLQ